MSKKQTNQEIKTHRRSRSFKIISRAGKLASQLSSKVITPVTVACTIRRIFRLKMVLNHQEACPVSHTTSKSFSYARLITLVQLTNFSRPKKLDKASWVDSPATSNKGKPIPNSRRLKILDL